MEIVIVSHPSLPSGYLTVRHGKLPFLSSVNHLFLWTIFHGYVSHHPSWTIFSWPKTIHLRDAEASISIPIATIAISSWWARRRVASTSAPRWGRHRGDTASLVPALSCRLCPRWCFVEVKSLTVSGRSVFWYVMRSSCSNSPPCPLK